MSSTNGVIHPPYTTPEKHLPLGYFWCGRCQAAKLPHIHPEDAEAK